MGGGPFGTSSRMKWGSLDLILDTLELMDGRLHGWHSQAGRGPGDELIEL